MHPQTRDILCPEHYRQLLEAKAAEEALSLRAALAKQEEADASEVAMLAGIPNPIERAITMIARLDPRSLGFVAGTTVVGISNVTGFVPWYAPRLCEFLICDEPATASLRKDGLPLSLVKAHSILDARQFAAWFAWYARSTGRAPFESYEVLVRIRQRVFLEPVAECSQHRGWILHEGGATSNRLESLTISDRGIAGLTIDRLEIPAPSRQMTVTIKGLALAAGILHGARN